MIRYFSCPLATFGVIVKNLFCLGSSSCCIRAVLYCRILRRDWYWFAFFNNYPNQDEMILLPQFSHRVYNCGKVGFCFYPIYRSFT